MTKRSSALILGWIGALAACTISIPGRAQTAVKLTVNAQCSNIASGTPIPSDFAGLGFEAGAELRGNARVSGYFFSPGNKQLVTIFQQMGIKNLRLGGGSADGCRTPIPQYDDPGKSSGAPDINNAFEFAQAAGLKVIYTLRMVNNSKCRVRDLAEQNARYADFIWKHYRANLDAFAFSNETDFHSAHSSCNAAGQCQCPYPFGCSGDPRHITTADPLIYETAVPGGRPVAGTAFPSYLSDWDAFARVLHNPSNGVPAVPLAGPDAGSYVGGGTNFSGTVPSCHNRNFPAATGWTQMFALCEKDANGFALPTQHYYPGGNISATVDGKVYALTAEEGISNMLSPEWVNEDAVTTEPYQPAGIPASSKLVFTGYPWLNATIPPGTRLTELNDYLGGVANASNSFASALWALDVMHWWALHGGAGVNFHNYQWIYTDTVVPGNLTTYGRGGKLDCRTNGIAAPCSDFVVNPKGYGIKAFNLGGHGYPIKVTPQILAHPGEFNLTAYAVASGQDLYVTVINKTQGTAAGDTASVTIAPRGLPFTHASASSILLWDGVAGNAGLLRASLGGASILNTGARWSGAWTPQIPDPNGEITLQVQSATAVVVHFQAESNYAGPIQINQNGALAIFATDGSGNLWIRSQKAGSVNIEPNSASEQWRAWTKFANADTHGVAGDVAVGRNLDNTLQIFASGKSSNADVFYSRQQTPGGTWDGWVDMGAGSAGISHLRVGKNADGSLSIFGLDRSGKLWSVSENAPGVAWSRWTELNASTLQPGYTVVRNLSGRLEIFGADDHGVLLHKTSTGAWQASWSSLGAPVGHSLTGDLQAVRDINGNLIVFALDTQGNVWSITQDHPSGSWRHWHALLGPASLRPGFVAGLNADGQWELFGVGTDNKLYDRVLGASNWAALGGPGRGIRPDLTVGNTNDGRLQLFATALDSPNHVWSIWQITSGGAWGRWADFGGSGLIFSRPHEPIP